MLFDSAFVGHRSEDALAFIVEILQSSTECSLIGKGLDGKILLWNEGARRLYGYEAAEVLGKATSEILHPPEDIADGLPAAMIEETLRHGKWEGLLTRVRKNGQRFPARATLTPRFDAAGRHTGYLLISKDVSDEIALTDKLSQKAGELRATNERLSALLGLNLQLGSELDLRQLLRSFSQAAREIIGARYSVAGILGADGSRFESLYTSGMDAETAARLGSPDPRARVLRTVLLENRCVRMRNPEDDPADLGFSPSHPPIHAWLGSPIASPARVYGYIGLIDKIGREEFSQEDERLTGVLAAKVGRVYQGGTLYSDALSRAADLEKEIAARAKAERALVELGRQGLLMGEVGASLTRSDTLQGMLQLCAEALVRHLDVALARIWTFKEADNVLELKASAGLYTHLDGPHSRIPLGQLKIGRIAQERTPHLTNDVLTDPQVSDKEWAKREQMVAFAGYPLIVEDRLLGVIGMFARQPLNAVTVDAIDSVADEVALGIERNRANQALREREEHIRLLLDSTAEAIFGVDLRGCCTFANSASARLLGYADPGQLPGRNMHALIHHSWQNGTPYPVEECRIFRALLRNQGCHVDDEVLWRADGSSFPAEYWSHPVYRDGQVVGSVVAFLDITERRQLEDQFRRAQQRLRHVVVSSPAVLFTLAIAGDQIHSISWISDNLREIFGYPPEVAIGPDWWAANVHPEDLGRVQAQTLAQLFTRGQSTPEYRFRRGDGSYCWTSCDMRLIRDGTGRPSEVVGAWSDITGLKRAEEEQSKLREQLQQAQKLESVGRLAGGVAHDFNNLLTVINGYSDLLLKQLTPDDPMHESVTEIRGAGQRAAALVRQLLLLSRKQVTRASEVNLNGVIAEVEKMLARVIGEDIRLESALGPSLGSVLADSGLLHQVLMNLAVNARDAMPGGGTLLIETRNVDLDDSFAEQHAGVKPGPYVQLKVSDTGIGMTKDVMSHVFEPFFTTKKPGEGTGLGLATVYGIVKQSGGSIWVHSEPGEGTAFTIYLPRIDAGVNLPPEAEPAPPSLRGTETVLVVEGQEQLRRMATWTGSRAMTDPPHILLVDDDRQVVRYLKKALEKNGYAVTTATSGKRALAIIRKRLPDLLILDLHMPEPDGLDLLRTERSKFPYLRILAISGYMHGALLETASVFGAIATLEKPVAAEALVARVREVLGR